MLTQKKIDNRFILKIFDLLKDNILKKIIIIHKKLNTENFVKKSQKINQINV